MGQSVQEWTKYYLWKTAFKIFEGIWSASLKFFKGCLPQILLGPFLNTLSPIIVLTLTSAQVWDSIRWRKSRRRCQFGIIVQAIQFWIKRNYPDLTIKFFHKNSGEKVKTICHNFELCGEFCPFLIMQLRS